MMGAIATLIDDLRRRGGLTGTDVANMAMVSAATVPLWASGESSPHPKTQLLISNLHYVVDRLAELYDPEEIHVWLYSKHPLLDAKRAVDFINQGRGDRVIAVVDSLNDAAYV